MPNYGRPIGERFWGRMDKQPNGCWVWTGACYGAGYGAISVNRTQYATHRLSWMLTNGSIPDGQEVCHKCDNRKCCNPDHLFIGTHQENVVDCWSKGRHPRVVTNRKLTDEQIADIRGTYPQLSMSALGRKHGVCVQQVSNIIKRKQWASL